MNRYLYMKFHRAVIADRNKETYEVKVEFFLSAFNLYPGGASWNTISKRANLAPDRTLSC